MSLASFAIGSNEVEATSTAASTAVLSISAISTNDDRDQERDQLEPRDVERERGDEHADRDGEVDPHVPLRAEDVDDPLDREVEALDDRGRATRA